ncbi:MAG: hypothetical protein ACPGTU_11260, partial [Myxococcota bacterium]
YVNAVNRLLPSDPTFITEARAAAENGGTDAELLELRELELAHVALPPVIDGVRRSRLLHADAIATTWEGWSMTGGQRVFMRCIRPRWKNDPVMLRRMGRGANEVDTSWHSDGDWPHIRVVANGTLLTDRFPVEDAPSTTKMAKLLGQSLLAMAKLHDRGHTHGGPLRHFLVETSNNVQLVWMDFFDAGATVQDDLRHIAETIVALDPTRNDPVAQLAEEWLETPPPSAYDGIRLLERCLGGILLSERHRLSIAGRSAHKMDRSFRLASAIRKLADKVPPPVGKVCLKAGNDGVLVIAESDGTVVRGGATADPIDIRFLPIIYTPSQGLDAQSARFLLRSWALRSQGDEESRTATQETLQATDICAENLVRWMSSMARLRAARLLLEAGQRAS